LKDLHDVPRRREALCRAVAHPEVFGGKRRSMVSGR
jgi:hypothetical protein